MKGSRLIRRLTVTEWTVVLYALVNAALYASLIPLWEGFDEPFHYGLVRDYGRATLPITGKTTLDGEVAASLKLTPISHLLKRNLGGGVTFDEYFRLDAGERAAMRARLNALDPALPGAGGNYEAQQAPLAYVVMAAVDRLSDGAPLTDRVYRLRLFIALISAAATSFALLWLAALLDAPPAAKVCALFVAMSGQMFYATTAHVANDWLATPLFLLMAAAGASLLKHPNVKRGAVLSALLAAALLAKASMLAAGPWVVLILLLRLPWRQALAALWPLLLAAPWYLRNFLLYGNLSGMHEFASRADGTSPLGAMPLVPWMDALWHMARSAVWTGNNSFTPMSRDLVATLLVLAAIGLLSAVVQDWRKRIPAHEGLMWPLAGLMAASLGYAIAVSFWFTRGMAYSAGPWYAQPLSLLLAVLLSVVLSRARLLGRVVMAASALLSAYMIVLTWWVKLIPLYAGVAVGRSTLRGVTDIYRNRGGELAARLAETAMAGPEFLFVMAAGSTILAVGLGLWTAAALRRD
ncbi:MAG TPA: hypothetical protein PKJ41_00725 [Bryobacteraceae bacterium]|nr:hypothetical protein [Bryobacteraceae bacterium]HPT25329.1 hypothetical protein [Bryobacteraceae bacterium]